MITHRNRTAVAGLAVVMVFLAAADPSQDQPASVTARDLMARLTSPDVDTRRAAAKSVFEADGPVRLAVLPRMRESLQSEKDSQVRLWLFDALTAMGSQAAPAVPELVFSLRTSFGGSRTEKLHQDYRAAIALASIGEPSVASLGELLTASDTKENVRAEAIMALGRIGRAAAASTPDLIPYLGHDSDRLRRESIVALGSIGTSAVPALTNAYESQNARVRASAIAALGRIGPQDAAAIEPVKRSIHDSAPEVRVAAIESLGTIGLSNEELAPLYRAAITSDEAKFVRTAIKGLVNRPDLIRILRPELEKSIGGGDPESAGAAAFAIAQLGNESIDSLLEALKRENSPIESIAPALIFLGRSATPRLIDALDSPNPRVRRGAALALGTIRPLAPETPLRLSEGLKNSDNDVRGAFLQALGDLGPRAGDAVPAIRGMLADPVPSIRAQAVTVLFRCSARDDRLVSDLSGLLEDSEPVVRIAAIDRLRALGPLGRKAMPRVTELLTTGDEATRRSAAAMIASHGPNAAEAVPALVRLLDEPKPEDRLLAMRTLARIGRPAQSAFPRLESISKSTNTDEREAVYQTIGSLGLDVESIRPMLAHGLNDSEERVRKAAIASVQQLGPPGAVMLPDLIRVAAHPQDLRAVERAVRRYERRGPDPRSVPDLIALSKHEKEPVQLLSIRFLSLVRPAAGEVKAALESLRNHSSEPVRKKAAEALQEMRTRGMEESKNQAL